MVQDRGFYFFQHTLETADSRVRFSLFAILDSPPGRLKVFLLNYPLIEGNFNLKLS